MREQRSTRIAVVTTAVMLTTIAAVFLIHNFGSVSVLRTWPLLLIAVGACTALADFIEAGLAVIGSFAIVFLANLEVIPDFGLSWPLILVWLALVVLFGFARSHLTGEHARS